MIHFPSRHVEISRLTLPIRDLPQRLAGLKIVQLSDFHFGARTLSDVVLQEAIAIAQQLQPDLVCYTGDFINGNPDSIDALSQMLQTLQGRLGNLAILGNHDILTATSAEKVTQSLESQGIQVLNDAVAYPCGLGLAFVGFVCPPYYSPGRFVPEPVMTQIPQHIPRIVLIHGPGYEKYLRPWRVDLQLSGHTHGGQLALPGLGDLIPRFWQGMDLFPKAIRQWIVARLPHRIAASEEYDLLRGLYSVQNGPLYVNRGLGAHFPGRLFCPPEVTEMTLVPAH